MTSVSPELPHLSQPVASIQWIPIEKVRANDYNPNSVAMNEMRLLYHSIKADGYTQPVVTIKDPESDLYIIVDGFHRYLTMKTYPDIAAMTGGLLPCVVLNKSINERMASTVRHNRARGKHSVAGMGNMVFQMLENGMDDQQVMVSLGLEPEELARLKYVTGFAKLFDNVEYRKAWQTRRMIQLEKAARDGTAADPDRTDPPVLEQSPA